MQRSLLYRCVFKIPRRDASFRRSPYVELGVGVYSSTIAGAVRVAAPAPPTHPPTDLPCTAAQEDVRQQHTISFMHWLFCCVVLRFPCFYDPPPYRGPGTAAFDGLRLSRLALGPVLSPIRSCAAWGGRGAVARTWAVACRSGEPFQNGAY